MISKYSHILVISLTETKMWDQIACWLPAVNSMLGFLFYCFLAYLLIMFAGFLFGDDVYAPSVEVESYKIRMLREKARKAWLAAYGACDKAE